MILIHCVLYIPRTLLKQILTIKYLNNYIHKNIHAHTYIHIYGKKKKKKKKEKRKKIKKIKNEKIEQNVKLLSKCQVPVL